MKQLFSVLIFLIGILPAQAQQTQSPEMQAMGERLMGEINGNLQCQANIIAGRKELEKLQAEIKQLKAKYEPKEQK